MRKKLVKMIGAALFLSMVLTSVCPLYAFAAEGGTVNVTEESVDQSISVVILEEEEKTDAEPVPDVQAEESSSKDSEKENGKTPSSGEEEKKEDTDAAAREEAAASDEEESKEEIKEEKIVEDGNAEKAAEKKEEITAEDPSEKEEEEETDGLVELAVTNNTAMFKVVKAYLEIKDGRTELVVSLSGTGYRNLFLGTYEDAVANGDNRSAWIPCFTDEEGKLAFRIPITEGVTFYPVVAISQTYLENYEAGKNPLARAFFPRQFTLDKKAKTLVTGDYEFSLPLEITNNVEEFEVKEASLENQGGPNSNNYKAELEVTLADDIFDEVFVGTADAAVKAAETLAVKDRIVIIPIKWVEKRGDPDSLVTLLENPFITSWHSVKDDKWIERKLTIDDKEGTLVIDEVTEEDKKDEDKPDDKQDEDKPDEKQDEDKPDEKQDEEKPDDRKEDQQEEQKGGDALDGGTAAVDNSTGLPDGVYTPDSFSFSGGSGRATISCRQVTVVNGQAFATIAFSSANYGYVKASGGTYYPSYEGGVSNFTIPIQLNQNNTIIGMTTAMSAAHEITYTIFVYIAAAEGKDAADVVNNDTIGEDDKMDETTPVIAGVTGGEEIEQEHAEYLKMFRYDNGMVLVEIDRTSGTVEELENTSKETAQINDAEDDADSVIEDEEAGSTQKVKTTADYQMELYQSSVVKYLVVPEGVEIPAGLDKKAIIIQLPKKTVYVSSEAAAADMESLGLLDLIKATGVTEENCKNEALKNLLKEKKAISAGAVTDPDYTKLLKTKVDLVIAAGEEIFPKEAEKDKTAKDYHEQYTKLTERLALLNIPLLIDRSADEKDTKGQLEWLQLYGVLFGKEEEAKELIAQGMK